jgi:radical SAM protein with 4Fe4S-binding SPASM domain
MVALWRVVCRDLALFGECLRPTAPVVRPGLYTYRFHPPGGQVRIHLRVHSDGSGVLFVDVTDVVHLNPTATEMVRWALDGLPESHARTRLRQRWKGGSAREAVSDLAMVYRLVDRFRQPGSGCPTCALDQLTRTDLFATAPSAPYKADLAITYECNNDCPHCYNETDRLHLGSLSPKDWKSVIDRLTDVGVPHLIFTGGEATLYPALPELVGHADARGPICGLNSNGRRFADRKYAQAMASAGLNHLQVTLGSHRAEVHNRMMNASSFAQTVRGISNALTAGLHTITNTTLMRMNADEIDQTIAFIHRLGIRTFAVNGMIYSGGGFANDEAIPEAEMAPLLIRIRDTARELGMRFLWYTPTQYCRLSPVELEVGAKRCNAGEYSICVEPNGDVLPCQSYYVAAGNILRDPWDTIWQGRLFVSFRERERDPRRHGLPEMCWECPDLPLCGGGCRIEREAAAGVRVAQSLPRGCAGCSGGCGRDGAAVGFVDRNTLRMKRRGTGLFATTGR